MAYVTLIRLTITCCVCVLYIKEVTCWQLPKDVELLEGHEPPPSWTHDSGLVNNDNQGSNRLIKAIRNRRALTYRFKSIPFSHGSDAEDQSSDQISGKVLKKRDLNNAFPNMDVSAQYMEQLAIARMDPRDKRETASESIGVNTELVDLTQGSEKEWIPQTSTKEDDVNTPPSETTENTFNNAEALVDKQNGRGARGTSKDQWIKLPYLGRPLENEQLSTAVSNTDEINHRMPRVNFVTQNKGLQTSESRNQRDSVPRGSYSRSSDLRTDFYPPNSRARSLDYSTYSRHSYYYPDEYRRRGQYDDLDYYDDFYYNQRRDPYYDRYDYKNGRRYDYNDYRSRGPYDRYDDNDYGRYDKPRRIIYYATLPDVVRTPPSVYRYPQNPYSRYDDDRYYRDNRYDNNNNNNNRGYYYSRYPYSALKKSETEGPRDLSVSSTSNKENGSDAAQKRQQEQQKKTGENRARDVSLNSHQYPINLSTNMNVDSSKSPHQTLYHDITRMDNDFHRYDHPSFQAAVDDPYVSRHD